MENIRRKCNSKVDLSKFMSKFIQKLYNEILGYRNMMVGSTSRENNMTIERLYHKRILVVFDDVEKLEKIDFFFLKIMIGLLQEVNYYNNKRQTLARYSSKILLCKVLQG